MPKRQPHGPYRPRAVLYQRFLSSLGVSPTEFQERFAQEVTGLTTAEMRSLKAALLDKPETWSAEQQHIFRKMFARTVAKIGRGQQTS